MSDGWGDEEPEAFSPAISSSPISMRTSSPESEVSSIASNEILPESICPVCLNLGNEVWDHAYRRRHGLDATERHRRRQHHIPIGHVDVAAHQSCSGCKIIAWVLEPYMKRLQDEGGEVEVRFEDTWKSYVARLNYYGHEVSPPGLRPCTIRLVVKSVHLRSSQGAPPLSNNLSCPWRLVKPVSMITCSTGSSAARDKVQEWYSECRSNHKECLSDSRSPLPTRVIHIQGPNKVRLYTSGTECAQYACLSHCWGGQSVIQTTAQNFEQHTVGICWEELPKTFQDAIQFAHSIGFEYLWIDSLCIIQDSIDDWRKEGSQMSRIYTNASITLSATWAANPRQGCFVTLHERHSSRTGTFMNSDDTTYELYCHEELRKRWENPLFERGWVFQERMLSTRVVHFMEQELWWECRESFRCECERFDHCLERRNLHRVFELSELSSLENIQQTWEALVSEYSSKLLTYPSDIFPAIQALAKLVPSKMGRYLAGHWESTLIWSLCWWKYSPKTDEHMEWRAPSWSWAATQGRTTWNQPSRSGKVKACATLISAQTIPEGNDPMGQISYGFIIVRGNLLVGEIQPGEREGKPYHHLILEGALIDSFNLWSVYWDGTCPDEDRKQIFTLKLLEEDIADVIQYWLVLTAVEGKEGEYMRIGILHAWINRPKRTDRYLKVLDAMNEAEEMDVKIV